MKNVIEVEEFERMLDTFVEEVICVHTDISWDSGLLEVRDGNPMARMLWKAHESYLLVSEPKLGVTFSKLKAKYSCLMAVLAHMINR